MELKFNLFFAVFQTITALFLAMLPVVSIFAIKPDQDPITIALWSFAGVVLPVGVLAYFGIRGLFRTVQIRVTEDGISGPLISRDGKIIDWNAVAFVKYKGGFLETLRIELQDKRKIVVRDFSQLHPWSLLEVFEVLRVKLETGQLTIPKKNRWWDSTWFSIVGVTVVSVILIIVANWFRGR